MPTCEQSSGPELGEEVGPLQRVVGLLRVSEGEDDDRRGARSAPRYPGVPQVWASSKEIQHAVTYAISLQ